MTETTEIKITDFYDPNDIRTILKLPFNHAGKTFASNGHIMAIFPLQTQYPPLEKDFQFVDRIINAIETSEFIPMPKIDMPEQIDCGNCQGTGKAINVDCEECEGVGELTFSNDYHDYDVTCDTCNGDGVITKIGNGVCDNCKGTGKRYDSRNAAMVNGVTINTNYLNLIINAPDLLICAQPDQNRLLFKSGQVSGVIMRYNP